MLSVAVQKFWHSESMLSLACSVANVGGFFTVLFFIRLDGSSDNLALFGALTSVLALHAALDAGVATTAAACRLARPAQAMGLHLYPARMLAITGLAVAGTSAMSAIPTFLYHSLLKTADSGLWPLLSLLSWLGVLGNGFGGIYRALRMNVSYQRARLTGICLGGAAATIASSQHWPVAAVFTAMLAPPAAASFMLIMWIARRSQLHTISTSRISRALRIAKQYGKRAASIQFFQLSFAGIWTSDAISSFFWGNKQSSTLIPVFQKFVQPVAIFANIYATNIIPKLQSTDPPTLSEKWGRMILVAAVAYLLTIILGGPALLTAIMNVPLGESLVQASGVAAWCVAEVFLAFSVAVAAANHWKRRFVAAGWAGIMLFMPLKIYIGTLQNTAASLIFTAVCLVGLALVLASWNGAVLIKRITRPQPH